MNAAAERKIIRWLHIIIAIPIVGYIYGPVAHIPEAARAVRWVFFPVLVLSGFWLWLGHRLKKRLRRKSPYLQAKTSNTHGNDFTGH